MNEAIKFVFVISEIVRQKLQKKFSMSDVLN